MKHPIPTAALDDRLFFGGTAGAGKTYNAMSAVERLLARKARVVIPDPLGVWWGLRLKADGKTPSGFDVVIFGGPHGDLPLTEHAGALIGETVAGMKESCILDLSQLGTKAAERRFMLAFLTAFYKHASGEPVHVIFDEADMWSPQRLLDKEGDAAKLLGMMETVVRRGRVRGFIPWLISQRPAVISKDVLSQVDGLIAFKLTSSQDRDAIGDWVEGQADKQQWKDIWAQLPTMERGQGVVWLPGRGVLATSQFPPKETFDSSRTPSRGERAQRAAELKPLDLGKLKDRLAKVEADTKANDPKALRAEIAALKAERDKLAKAKAPAAKADPDAIAKAKSDGDFAGYKRGKIEGYAAAALDVQGVMGALTAALGPALDAMGALRQPVRSLETWAARAAKAPPAVYTALAKGSPAAAAKPNTTAPHAPRREPVATPIAVASGSGNFTRPQNKVLQSLAMWRALGHDTPSREMVAAVAGYSPSSGGFNNLLGGLKTNGLIDYPQPGRVALTADGIPVPSREDGATLLMSTLSNPQKKIVGALLDRGTRSRDDVGADTGYSPSSGGFNNLLGSLRTLGIIGYPAPRSVSMTVWAQELLSGYGERLAA